MKSYERVMLTLEGKTPDRSPVVPIVKEWCYKQVDLEFVLEEHQVEKHVYAQTYCLSHFGYDAVLSAYGPHSESEAMGCILKTSKGHVASIVKHAVEDYERDLPRLKLFDPHHQKRMITILEGQRRMKTRFQYEIPVLGFVQGPFRHTCMLRGIEQVMRDIHKNKEKLKELCEIALYSLIVYAVSVINAGADIIMIADPTSSADMLSRKHWEEWGMPLTKKLVRVIKPHGVKTILHVCGNTEDRFESLASTEVDCLSLDEAVDFEKARKALGPNYCLMGNVSTTLMSLGTPEEVEEATKEVIGKSGKGGSLIVSGGCELGETCKSENMLAMVRAAKETPI